MGYVGASTGKLAENSIPQRQVPGHPLQPQLPWSTKLPAIAQPLFTQTRTLRFRRFYFPFSQSQHRNEPKHRAFYHTFSASLLIIYVPAHGELPAEEKMKYWRFQSETFSRMHALLPQELLGCHARSQQHTQLHIPFSISRWTSKQAEMPKIISFQDAFVSKKLTSN